MSTRLLAVVVIAMALPCSVVRGQVVWATSRAPFSFQVPAIRVMSNYPSELSSLKVDFQAMIWVELGPSSISREPVAIPAGQVPHQTLDYVRSLAWIQLQRLSHPQNGDP